MKRQKLTKTDVLAIRASDDTTAALSRKFGVSKTLIRDIRLGRRWKSVGGRIRVAAVAGVKWTPKPGDIEKAVAAIEETGAWSDGARAIGISDGTIKAYAGRNAEHGAALREAVSKGDAKTEAADLESLKAALALRRVSRSWGDVTAELGLSAHRIAYLSDRFGMREEYKAAADAGRAHWERETLKAAAKAVREMGTWSAACGAVDVAPAHIQVLRKRHPDLDEMCQQAWLGAASKRRTKHVYVLEDGHGRVKIGVSARVETRRRQLLSGNSSGILRVVFSAPCADPFTVETAIRRRLQDHQVPNTREWFTAPAVVAADIAKEELRARADASSQSALL